jgi:hypothetical protein
VVLRVSVVNEAAIETCNESNDRRDYQSGSSDLVCGWDRKAEPAAHAHRTLHVKRAPMCLDDTARDREAQPGTVAVGAVALLPVPVEDMR